MAINSVGQDASIYGNKTTSTQSVKNKTTLGKDDFMTLLLAELQHQDPTKPTDTEAILTQTSQLSSLDASSKTNKALADLSKTLATSSNFGAISAIGKTADLGSNMITYTKGKDSNFDLYFPSDVASGNVTISDSNGNVIKTISAEKGKAGTYKYTWDGKDSAGNKVDAGAYYVKASYTNAEGKNLTTKLGTYPIEAVKFDDGTTYAKVDSKYVALEKISEIY